MLLAALLLAQTAPQCAALDQGLPAPLAAWTTPGHGDPADIRKTVTLEALIAADVPGLPSRAREGAAARVGFRIDQAGIYGIALDQPGWIDVVPDGRIEPLVSVSHGHGPACSTIRKIVRFRLEPGIYTLYLSGLKSAMARVMLVSGD